MALHKLPNRSRRQNTPTSARAARLTTRRCDLARPLFLPPYASTGTKAAMLNAPISVKTATAPASAAANRPQPVRPRSRRCAPCRTSPAVRPSSLPLRSATYATVTGRRSLWPCRGANESRSTGPASRLARRERDAREDQRANQQPQPPPMRSESRPKSGFVNIPVSVEMATISPSSASDAPSDAAKSGSRGVLPI